MNDASAKNPAPVPLDSSGAKPGKAPPMVMFTPETLGALLAPGQRLIGLDVGSKTIGLALSDVSRTIATALLTIQRTKFKADAARLLAIAAEHKAGALIIGLPTNMDGSSGPRVQSTKSFARHLSLLTNLPLAFWDERLSTAAVERTLIEADTTRKRRAEVIDKMAAAFILQGFLDRSQRLAALPD